MLIEIDRLSEEGLEISKDFEVFSGELVEENAVFLKPVHADVTIKKIGEEIFIQGYISTCLSLICSRCLSPYEYCIDSDFNHVYLPEELEIEKEQLESDDMNRLFYYSRKLDLKEIILEQLNFTFPLRPMCSADCQGICPICGKIIKEGNCSCAATDSDPRLDKFKIFLRDKR